MKLKGIELKGTYKVIYDTISFVVCDEKDNQIYFGNNNSYWSKTEYDEKGNRTYYENSYDYWAKWEYNEKGDVIYCEDKGGILVNKRIKELTIEEIEKLLGYKIKIKGK